MEKEQKEINIEELDKEVEPKEKIKKMDEKKLIFVAISAVVLLLLGFLVFKFSPNKKSIGIEDAKVKTENFINENLMLPGTKATVTEIIKEYGLYKVSVDVGSGEIIESYISQDGELFFPQSIDINEYEQLNGNVDSIENKEISNKQEKLDIELFVMSHCPYGTQIEKGLLPVLDLLKNHLSFELKFNTYAMHDKEELDEQLTQYCIQKEEKSKLLSYLDCFNKTGISDQCQNEVAINKSKISSCVASSDKEFKISESYNDKNTWVNETYPIFPIFQDDNEKYGVQGSPTLVINGEISSSERDSQSLLDLACSGFINQPEECQTKLSDVAPSFGFGE